MRPARSTLQHSSSGSTPVKAARSRPMAAACPGFVHASISQAGREPRAYKQFTLVLVHTDGQLLLGLKKRGFGTGFWNGFGGKVEPGESVEAAAQRELQEEAGITALDLAPCGRLFFVFDDKADTPWEVHVFRAHRYQGQPTESEEMRPAWFGQEALPFDQMWADDRHWYPLFVAGHSFVGLFGFTDTTTMLWHQLRQVPAGGGGLAALAAPDLLTPA